MDILHLNKSSKDALCIAQDLVKEYRSAFLSSGHLLMGLLNKKVGLNLIIPVLGVDVEYLVEWAEVRMEDCPKGDAEAVAADEKVLNVLEEAEKIRIQLGLSEVSPICLLSALVRPNVGFTTDQLKTFPFLESDIMEKLLCEHDAGEMTVSPQRIVEQRLPDDLLHTYCVDKITMAAEGKLLPIVGREPEVKAVAEMLCVYNCSGVMITGGPGVGKTTLVNGLACDIATGNVPYHLKGVTIFELSVEELLSVVTYAGEAEERLINIFREIRLKEKVILFIDDIHQLLNSRSSHSNVGAILMQELAEGGVVIIGTTTTDEYGKMVDSACSFGKYFDEMCLTEPDMSLAIQMVKDAYSRFVIHYQIEATEKALESCVYFAKRYIQNRKLPDSAIYLLDRAMAIVKVDIQRDTLTSVVTEREVAAVVSGRVEVPIDKILMGERERFMNLENQLRRKIVGQDNALRELSDALVKSLTETRKPGQPKGCYFFYGPSGTGKTELAKALAEALFNDERALIRFDMSEFKDEHSAALLCVSPAGYISYAERGMLIDKIRRQPYSVVLFDGVDRAHPSLYNVFQQIIDEGKICDNLGAEGDFSHAVILFASNAGGERLTDHVAKGKAPSMRQLINFMERSFHPEFLSRLSGIIPFVPVDKEMLLQVFTIHLRGLTEWLLDKKIELKLTDEVMVLLATKDFNPKLGAHQISSIVRGYLRIPISRLLVTGIVIPGMTIQIGIGVNGELLWEYLRINEKGT